MPIKNDLFAVEKKILDIMGILNKYLDPYERTPQELRTKSQEYIRELIKIKDDIQPLLKKEWGEIIEEEFKDTGKIDIDRTAALPDEESDKITTIKMIVIKLEKKIGKTIQTDDIIKEAEEKGIDSKKTQEIIERLKRSGDLFEPRRGFLQRI